MSEQISENETDEIVGKLMSAYGEDDVCESYRKHNEIMEQTHAQKKDYDLRLEESVREHIKSDWRGFGR